LTLVSHRLFPFTFTRNFSILTQHNTTPHKHTSFWNVFCLSLLMNSYSRGTCLTVVYSGLKLILIYLRIETSCFLKCYVVFLIVTVNKVLKYEDKLKNMMTYYNYVCIIFCTNEKHFTPSFCHLSKSVQTHIVLECILFVTSNEQILNVYLFYSGLLGLKLVLIYLRMETSCFLKFFIVYFIITINKVLKI
jgi:hypothetical protein